MPFDGSEGTIQHPVIRKMSELFNGGKGWVQGRSIDMSDEDNHRYCLLGALRIACDGRKAVEEIDAFNSIAYGIMTYSRVNKKYTRGLRSITRFNDDTITTYQDIEGVLKTANKWLLDRGK